MLLLLLCLLFTLFCVCPSFWCCNSHHIAGSALFFLQVVEVSKTVLGAAPLIPVVTRWNTLHTLSSGFSRRTWTRSTRSYQTSRWAYSLFFLTWPMDFAPAQCYHHQFRHNSAARLGKTNCRPSHHPEISVLKEYVRITTSPSSYCSFHLGAGTWFLTAWEKFTPACV